MTSPPRLHYLLLEENAELERQLDAAQAEIRRLEDQLRLWRSGAKSLALARLEERVASSGAVG